jgi:hypothetical protein
VEGAAYRVAADISEGWRQTISAFRFLDMIGNATTSIRADRILAGIFSSGV